MALEDLRILRETTTLYRARPESESARRRLDEAIRYASRRHPPETIADAAPLPISEVLSVLAPGEGIGGPEPARRESAVGIRARFRSSTA